MKKEFYHDIDLKANQLFNSRLQNVTTSERTTLGLSLTTSSKGYIVYDINLFSLFLWDGTQWQQAGGGATWGSITGIITAQTDLVNYIAGLYTPKSRTLTINGVTQDLSADRTWSVGTITSVGATSPITSSGGNTPTISTSMATNKLIGRSSAGTGVMEQITVGTGLSLSGGTLNATGTSASVGFEQNFLLMGA